MKIGYARVSTLDQNLDLQINALTAAGCELIFQEKLSGSLKDRPELTRLLSQLRKGDEVIVWKLDRLGRSLVNLVELVEIWQKQEVGLVSLNDPIDTTTAQGRLVFSIFASLAEYERAQTQERTRAGLLAARLKGNIGGKPKGLNEVAKQQARVVESLYKEGHSVSVIAKQLSISRTTVYKYLEYREVSIKISQ